MGISGLGKPRTILGNWLDENNLLEKWLIEKSEINKNTVTAVCGDPDYMPSGKTMQKIIKALREVDPSVRADQFWDL